MDEDEQPLDDLPIRLSLQLGLDQLEESNMKPVFINIGPMTLFEASRKPGDRPSGGPKKATVTTLMSHFRLLRHTIDSYDQVRTSLSSPITN